MGIVGAVILTGAMIAVFYYENSNANADDTVLGEGDNLYTIQWAEETHPATASGNKFQGGETIQAGESNAATYDVSIPNYTSEVTVRLEWSDDQAASQLNQEDQFRVELLDPAGNVVDQPKEGNAGTLDFAWTVPAEAPVAGEPAEKIVTARGDTEEDAEAAVKEDAGSATYQIRVTLLDTNSEVPDPLAGTAGDTSNSFEVYLGYTHWHAWEQSRLPVEA